MNFLYYFFSYFFYFSI